ncbi:MAG: putative phosphotransferase [uncultured Acidimicrobiales bacterium]|uniref:Putative phosphotransferase n=1 Tax=uncultured Acidimicrobiales bacterium TaxID=310071 RepID=A0A6J4I6X6_9ACTN|nr:MAG: putative phosphotransferase [uncultured Acidimicrobiales bacterium]
MTPLKLHADEVEVDDGLVRALIARQLPQWAHLPLRRTASTGTDNAIFRLGEDMGVRVPRIHWAVQQIDKERTWLPRLARHLPVAVPEPLAKGEPGLGYPYPWLVYRWLEGEDALVGRVDDWCALARDVAAFVNALHGIETTGAPPAGARGGLLSRRDASTRRAIASLAGEIDVGRAAEVWETALAAEPWSGEPVWVHGDLLPGNVLVVGGALAGVIDWSPAGVGDPACDAMFAWSLPLDARAVYRTALAIDDATWARARGWSLEQAATFIPYYARTIPDGVASARRRLDAVLADEP